MFILPLGSKVQKLLTDLEIVTVERKRN